MNKGFIELLLNAFHAERDAVALQVNFHHTYHHMLVQADNGGGVFHELIGQLADMNQPLGVNAHIYESTEVGDVADNARQDHARAKVGQLVHGGIEGKLGKRLARVATRFLQLCHNVL